MPGTGSYERGDRPRSVPDPLDADMRRMEAQQRAYNQRQEQIARSSTAARKPTAPAAQKEDWLAEHPGLVESMVPVWGSAREAIADYKEGDMLGAVGNGVLAVTDLAPGGYAVKGIAKGAFKTGSHTWGATRKWMGKKGMLGPGQPGHHGIIPNGGWGKSVPDVIKNHPANITATGGVEDHTRIHSRYKGLPRYGFVERTWRGSPHWTRAAAVTWIPGGAFTTVDSTVERSQKSRSGGR